MSSTPNNPYLVKSMNGAIMIDDGGGTTISNGTITTTSLSLNNLLASATNTACYLWSNIVSASIYIGSQTKSGLSVFIGKNIVITDDGMNTNSGTLMNIGTVLLQVFCLGQQLNQRERITHRQQVMISPMLPILSVTYQEFSQTF
jgi:hypothetical protein